MHCRQVAALVGCLAVASGSLDAQRARGAQAAPSRTSLPRTERPVPYQVGEALTYDVSWSQYMTAGTATITVREKRPSFDSIAYYVVAEGRPTALLSKLYTLYYKVDTLIDAYTLLPQRGSVYSEEGNRRRMKATRFDQAARRATFEVTTATVVKTELQLPPFTQDPLSAIYVLRALPLRQGLKLKMPVADNGRFYKVQFEVTGRETITTPYGTYPAWRVTPVIFTQSGQQADEKVGLWISDDARRLPLKLEAELAVGRFVILLRDARE